MTRRVVILYERAGCELCEEAAMLLGRLAPRFGLDIRRVDVDRDPELGHRFGDAVPVVMSEDGRELARAPIGAEALSRVLTPFRGNPRILQWPRNQTFL